MREREATGSSDTESDSVDELQDILWARKVREGIAERRKESGGPNPQASSETSNHQRRSADQNWTAAYRNDQSEGPNVAHNGDHAAHDDFYHAAHDDHSIDADGGAPTGSPPSEDDEPSFWAQPTAGVGAS